MKKLITSSLLILFANQSYSQKKMKMLIENGMTVSWAFKEDRIYIEMEAPTEGWVAIGFNNSENTTGNYLIMGNVINRKVIIEEHYTISTGNYKSFEVLNTKSSLKNKEGSEINNVTKLKFSLPQSSTNKYARNLKEGSEYILLIAFSQEDDFQHHSIMRNSKKINL
jgi:V8-like Glu-specific endopeptidase